MAVVVYLKIFKRIDLNILLPMLSNCIYLLKKQNANNSLVFKLNVILLFFLTQLLVYIDEVNSVFVMHTEAGKLINLMDSIDLDQTETNYDGLKVCFIYIDLLFRRRLNLF